MHAIVISEFGTSDVLRYVERPPAAPKNGEIVVAARAIGVNYADLWMRRGQYPNPAPLPFVPGWEVVGVVDQLGAVVIGPPVGTRVAVPLFAHGILTGGYAERVTVDAAALVPIPDGVSDEAAAALLMQGTTARFLLEHTPPRGHRVLISAAAGGVGTLLIQLTKMAGATQVIALASTAEKLSLARELGADIAIDYARADWMDRVRAATDGVGPDLVLDSVGGNVARSGIDLLAPGGTFAMYGASSLDIVTLDAAQVLRMGSRNQLFTSFTLSPALADPPRWRSGLEALFRQVANGSLRTVIGSRWPLADAAAAHRAVEERRTVGKVILTP